MRVLFLVDLHGRAPEPFEADLVLLGGDLTHFGEAEKARDLVSAFRGPVRAVAGNCDRPSVLEYLGSQGLDLEREGYPCEGVWIGGLGAGLPFGDTPYERTEAEFEQACLGLEARRPKGQPWLLVSHQPPYGTACDRARRVGHVGSHAIRSFIQTSQPLLVLCGHIHESIGEDRIGDSRVVNPGPSAQGHGLRFTLSMGAVSQVEIW